MNDMEHLNERLAAVEREAWVQVYTEINDQYVCTISKGAKRAMVTARHFIDLHNAALDAEQAKQDDNAPPKGYKLATDDERRLYPYPVDCEVLFVIDLAPGKWQKSIDDSCWTDNHNVWFTVPESYQFIDRSDEADAERMRWLLKGSACRMKIDKAMDEG